MKIKIILKSGYYYKGTIISENEDSITLNDVNNKKVTIQKDVIGVREEIGE